MNRYTLDCRPLPEFDRENLHAVRDAFGQAPACEMRQAWLPAQQPEMLPSVVRVGRQGDELLVLAELRDKDIYNTATKLNDETFLLGDAFEMFLRPQRQSAYVEFHVTPNNVKLQLRFPDESAIFGPPNKRKPLAAWTLRPEVFYSRTWVQPDQECWWVLAAIPTQAVYARPAALPGESWLFSFSRYDYTHGAHAPILSSTSPHAVCSFHRQQEWGTLRFV